MKKQIKNKSQKKSQKKYKKTHGGDDTPKTPTPQEQPPVEKEKSSKSFLCGIPVVGSLVGFFGMCSEPDESPQQIEETPKSTEEIQTPKTMDDSQSQSINTNTPNTLENKFQKTTETPESIETETKTGGKRTRKTKKSRRSKK